MVVFGAESSGKSTILERVTMLPLFPKGDGICTRLPILVSVRQSAEDSPPRLTVVENGTDIDYDDIESVETIRQIMDESVKRENQSVCGVSKISHIKLVVEGPNYPNLDLLDLPGLVVNHGSNEPKTMEKDTHDLLHTWIEKTKGRAIYLAIREVSENWKVSQVHRVLDQHEFMRENTLGVLTKCDKTRNGPIHHALNDETDAINRGPHKYVLTSNPPVVGNDLKAQAAAECAFFEEEGFGKLVREGRATCDALVAKIGTIYNAYLLDTWVPTTYRLLDARKRQLEADIVALGVPLEGDPTLQGTVSHTAMELVNGFVEREFENVVQTVLIPLEDQVVETVQAQVGNDMDLKAMQRTLNAKGEGSLVDAVVTVVQQAVGCMEENFVSGLEAALLEDAPGKGGSTAVRVGRFKDFAGPTYIQ